MTTRRSIYLYPDDLERLTVLKARYGLGTSAATRAGLALLLAHLQDEDRQHALDTTVGPIRRKGKEMYEKVETIRVEFYEDNLSNDWEGYDVKASMDRYAEHLVNYLYAEYPDAEIEVVQTNGTGRTLVNGMPDHPEVENVELIGSRVWNDADWEVELAA